MFYKRPLIWEVPYPPDSGPIRVRDRFGEITEKIVGKKLYEEMVDAARASYNQQARQP
jgi:hypothetical protein